MPASFSDRLTAKVKQHLRSTNVGFLLGAGSSYLNGEGYPLAAALWSAIKPLLHSDDQEKIQQKLDSGAPGLEEALDQLDDGIASTFGLRDRTASAVATHFRACSPTLEYHRAFVKGIAQLRERRIPVFTLNYDSLIERAADAESLLFCDGFMGGTNAFFDSQSFSYRLGVPERRKGKSVVAPLRGVINLYKLHGSAEWYLDSTRVIRRGHPNQPLPTGTRLFMIPPGHRKGSDTLYPPYSTLWSEFFGQLARDKFHLLSRLVCVGYGLRDGHVNVALEAARARQHCTIIILSRSIGDDQFNSWKSHKNVIIATRDRCSLYGEEGEGHSELWSFEWLAQEVKSHA